jgi:hypothetical protein
MDFYKRFLIGLGTFLVAVIIGYGFWHFNAGVYNLFVFGEPKVKKSTLEQKKPKDNPLKIEINYSEEDSKKEEIKAPEPKKEVTETMVFNQVPFAAQAPFAQWDDDVYQDGCEEAASLMAVYWARSKTLTKIEASRKILDMANYQDKNYGDYIDTSSDDTLNRIIKGYFGYEKAKVMKNFGISDIRHQLDLGNIIIVPTNGQKLDNPNYKAPGPEKHNLVIVGYDPGTDEFITNDPGTKNGEGYRYLYGVLYRAIYNYDTSNTIEVGLGEKAMIVVWK